MGMEQRKTRINGNKILKFKKLEKQKTKTDKNDDDLATKKGKENNEGKRITTKKEKTNNEKDKKTTTSKKENKTWKLATWNIGGVTGKEIELNEILEESDIDILAITETKKKMKGYEVLEGGHLMIYSGVDNTQWAKGGVGCIINKRNTNGIRDWKGISGRLLRVEIEQNEEIFTILITYGPNEGAQKTEIEEFWNKLQEEVDSSKGILMIIGDMNGRVGNNIEEANDCVGKFGEKVKNNNGQRILDFCVMNNLVVSNIFYEPKDIHKYTREMPSRSERSIIDLLLVEKNVLKKIKDIRVKRGYEVGSDHFLVMVTIKNKTAQKKVVENEKKIEYTSIKTYKLDSKEKQKKYQEKIKEEIKLRENILNEADLEKTWETYKTIIITAAAEVCGVNKTTNKKKLTHWWNREIKEEIKKKKRLWKKYLGNNKNLDDYQLYKNQREKVKIKVKEAKAKSWEEFGVKMEENASGNAKMLYHILRGLRKGKKNPLKNVKDKEGEIITEENKIAKRWKEYYEELLSRGHIELQEETGKMDKTQEEEHDDEKELDEEENEAEITRDEIVKIVNKIKIGKAPGIDGLRPEMIKYMGNEGITLLHRMLNLAWTTQTIRNEWNSAIITPIHKKGNFNDCNNYRGISLLCTTYKVYERIIEERLKGKIEKTLSDSQAAFRADRTTQDWIFAIRQITEKITSTNSKMFMAAIDSEKAFDSLKREEIWKILKARKINKKLIEVIRSIYRKTENVVRVGGIRTESFITTREVRQGGVLSRLLFIIVMDEISKQVNGKTKKTHIGYRKLRPVYINELMYADDLLIFANSKEELQNKIEKWSKEIEKYGLQINREKTEIMEIANQTEDVQLQIQGKPIKNVNKLKYLGTITKTDGK